MDGISINISTAVVSALVGAGGLAGVLGACGKLSGGKKDTTICIELEHRIQRLENNDAKNSALLDSIDKRLENLTHLILKRG